MPRHLAMLILVATLAGSMVGVGLAATWGDTGPAAPVAAAPETSSPLPTADPPEPTGTATVTPRPTPRPTPPREASTETSRPGPTPGTAPEAESPPTVAPGPTETPRPTAGDEITRVQRRLTDLGYYVGPVDGKAGPATAGAVMAFQKVNELSADGVIGPRTLAALDDPVTPTLRGGPGDRVEVDLTKQVLHYVRNGQLERTLPVSSGSGESYRTASGGTARSLTPVGTFEIERHIRGIREAPLGTLYDPMYFHRGWAIHGSNSVPAYPASHGCVRVSRADAKWLFDRLPIGTTVIVYGGTHTFTVGHSAAGTDTPAG